MAHANPTPITNSKKLKGAIFLSGACSRVFSAGMTKPHSSRTRNGNAIITPIMNDSLNFSMNASVALVKMGMTIVPFGTRFRIALIARSLR